MTEHQLSFKHNVRVLPDPKASGTIDVGPYKRASCSLTSLAAETRTVLAPTSENQELTLSMAVDGGDITVTCTSGPTLTFNDAGDLQVIRSYLNGTTLTWKKIIDV